ELEEGEITEYKGNYSDYIEQKENKKKHQQKEYEKIKQKEQQIEEAIIQKDRQAERATKTPKKLYASEARIKRAKPYFAKEQKRKKKTKEKKKKQKKKKHQQKKYKKIKQKEQKLEEAIIQKDRQAERATKAPKNLSSSEARIKGAKPYFAKLQKGLHQNRKALQTRLEKLEEIKKPKEEYPIKMTLPNTRSFENKVILRAQKVAGQVGDKKLWKPTTFF